MNTPILETKRLILRKFLDKDIKALFQIFKDEEVNKFLPWYPVKTIEEAKEFYEERYREKYKLSQAYAYAICLKNDDVPIGYVNVDITDTYELGYGLLKEFWHQGIVTEAVKAVVEQIKKDGIPYIIATHDINNPRSGKVMQQVGMKYCYSYEECVQPKNTLVTFRMYQLNFEKDSSFINKKFWNMYDNHFIEEDIE